jgi:hypothetical protein
MLRYLVRAEAAGQTPTGRELRLVPTRATKDGTFLDRLVARGLLAVTAKPTPPARGREHEPAQFRTRYKLTELGRSAAEYGEYEQAHTPADRPLTGLAADVIGPLIEKAARPAGKKGRKG